MTIPVRSGIINLGKPLKMHETIKAYNKFIKNRWIKSSKRVTYRGVNLNTKRFKELILGVIIDKISKEKFTEFLNREFNISNDHTFLFSLIRVAKLNFNFIEYCRLINLFASWNNRFRRYYHAARMFKNMIIKRRIGENFPINSPEGLKYKLELFNEIFSSRRLTYLGILDCASSDFVEHKIKPSEYVQVIYLIVKCVNKLFEREVCKRAHSTFLKAGDNIRAFEFLRLACRIKY